jgi:WhiB family redox-sensing transcriptional regulator
MVDQESGIDYSWENFAACKDLSIKQKEDFFPLKDDGGGKLQVNRARRLCADCPVVVECLHAALTTNERYGVWGMTSPKQRLLMRRKYTVKNEAGEKVLLYEDIDNVVEILADHIGNMVEVGGGYYPVVLTNPTLPKLGGIIED